MPVMELRQIRKRSLVERLVAEVRGQITAGRLAEGQQLPTEARMAAEFGVSRPLLREALAELRADEALAEMVLLRRGSRLSVQPVAAGEWKRIVKLGARK